MNPWPNEILKTNFNKPTEVVVPPDILKQQGFATVDKATIRQGPRGGYRLDIIGTSPAGGSHLVSMEAPDVSTYEVKT